MRNQNSARFRGLAFACVLFLLGGSSKADDQRAPAVPDILNAPEGNKVHFHVFAQGVQIYSWNGTTWVFQFPEATLYDLEGNVVGIHYAGPTWETLSGSKVVAARVDGAPSPNANSIPLLLLRRVTSAGPGILAATTYIQRVATFGGIAPAHPGTLIGEEARVPYTADYYFYRAK